MVSGFRFSSLKRSNIANFRAVALRLKVLALRLTIVSILAGIQIVSNHDAERKIVLVIVLHMPLRILANPLYFCSNPFIWRYSPDHFYRPSILPTT